MKHIDVLVHPYFTEGNGYSVDPSVTRLKTVRWRGALSELHPRDWLVFVKAYSGVEKCRAAELSDELLTYATGKLGSHVLVYDKWVDEDVKMRLGSPHVDAIGRIRGYGELADICVNRYTGHVRSRLGVYGKDLKKVVMPPELSVNGYPPYTLGDVSR
ncbi:MAG: hypothetical protein HYY37_03225 [Candidatus Aenigmarchaeota archaeon]|nr:hypothetical protein [Candidatus Aenigmarchaeota archaeon]